MYAAGAGPIAAAVRWVVVARGRGVLPSLVVGGLAPPVVLHYAYCCCQCVRLGKSFVIRPACMFMRSLGNTMYTGRSAQKR